MSNIDEIIKRSRKPGGFQSKGFFTLEIHKARQKISEFALPAVEYAILEFTQSAAAIGAKLVDISAARHPVVVSFVGGYYTGEELQRLFDYLLLDIDDARVRALRRLAVGVAAVLKENSPGVVIESGNGTLNGSARLEIRNLKDEFTLGTPQKPIDGTYIRVGMPSSHDFGKRIGSFLQRSMEAFSEEGINVSPDDVRISNVEALVYARCLYSIVPLQLNGELITGYNTSKSMKMRHLRFPVAFDEGDLYGGIGMMHDTEHPAELKILTNGIWVETIHPDLPKGLFGVVGYERIHKTASQYGIVRDNRLDEMLERLKPHVDKILVDVGATKRERLAALFTNKIPGLNIPENAIQYTTKTSYGDVTATLWLWPSPEVSNRSLTLTVVSADEKLIDNVAFDLNGAAEGVLVVNFKYLSFDSIIYRTLSETEGNTVALVGLKTQFYSNLFSQIGIDWKLVSQDIDRLRNSERSNTSEILVKNQPADDWLDDVPKPSGDREVTSVDYLQELLSDTPPQPSLKNAPRKVDISLESPEAAPATGLDESESVPNDDCAFPPLTDLSSRLSTSDYQTAIVPTIERILQYSFSFSTNDVFSNANARVVFRDNMAPSKAIDVSIDLANADESSGDESPTVNIHLNSKHHGMARLLNAIPNVPAKLYLLLFEVFDALRNPVRGQLNASLEDCEQSIYRPLMMNLQPEFWND